jgi:hypothetical protein
MAKGTALDHDFLALIFNGTAMAGAALAINATTTPITNLFVSLHVADPGAGGTQSTSEIGYGGYGRVAVTRTSGGWTVTANTVIPAAVITFPIGTAGTSPTATNWAIGTVSSGATEILWTGTVTPNILCGPGVTPILTQASTVIET